MRALVLYCAADLIWATKIRGVAEAVGVASRPVRDPAMLEARLADSPVKGLIVDLEAPAALDLVRLLRGPEAGERERAVRIVAFGAHVEVERLAAAKAAGTDRVMVRGAFDRGLAAILTELEAGSESM